MAHSLSDIIKESVDGFVDHAGTVKARDKTIEALVDIVTRPNCVVFVPPDHGAADAILKVGMRFTVSEKAMLRAADDVTSPLAPVVAMHRHLSAQWRPRPGGDEPRIAPILTLVAKRPMEKPTKEQEADPVWTFRVRFPQLEGRGPHAGLFVELRVAHIHASDVLRYA